MKESVFVWDSALRSEEPLSRFTPSHPGLYYIHPTASIWASMNSSTISGYPFSFVLHTYILLSAWVIDRHSTLKCFQIFACHGGFLHPSAGGGVNETSGCSYCWNVRILLSASCEFPTNVQLINSWNKPRKPDQSWTIPIIFFLFIAFFVGSFLVLLAAHSLEFNKMFLHKLAVGVQASGLSTSSTFDMRFFGAQFLDSFLVWVVSVEAWAVELNIHSTEKKEMSEKTVSEQNCMLIHCWRNENKSTDFWWFFKFSATFPGPCQFSHSIYHKDKWIQNWVARSSCNSCPDKHTNSILFDEHDGNVHCTTWDPTQDIRKSNDNNCQNKCSVGLFFVFLHCISEQSRLSGTILARWRAYKKHALCFSWKKREAKPVECSSVAISNNVQAGSLLHRTKLFARHNRNCSCN